MIAKVIKPETKAIDRSISALGAGMDFVIIGLSFLLSYSLLSVTLNHTSLAVALIFTAVSMISIRLSKLYFDFKSIAKNSLNIENVLSSLTGLAIGTGFILIKQFTVPGIDELIFATLLSAFIAFFVLGTLTPLINLD